MTATIVATKFKSGSIDSGVVYDCRLKKPAELRASGVLTNEEFAEQKAKLRADLRSDGRGYRESARQFGAHQRQDLGNAHVPT